MLPLCLLQNKVVRIITYSKNRAPVDNLYLELNLLPLHKIAHHRIALMMYKYHHAMLPIALQDLYIKTNSFTIIGPDNTIYCMFQAAHTQKKFSTSAYWFGITYRAWALNLIYLFINLKGQ